MTKIRDKVVLIGIGNSRRVLIEQWEGSLNRQPFWTLRDDAGYLAEHPPGTTGHGPGRTDHPHLALSFPSGSLAEKMAMAWLQGPAVPAPTNGEHAEPTGLKFAPIFADPMVHPFDQIRWKTQTVTIPGKPGEPPVFHQDRVEAPESWSDNSVQITASKYFYGDAAKGHNPAGGGREQSVSQLVRRVCDTIARWGNDDGYFATDADFQTFRNELIWLCLNQHGAFNSPVWFNVGLAMFYGIEGPANGWQINPDGTVERCQDAYKHPQGSACFIQSIKDDMESICELATSEMMLFKYGSGTGTDLSPLRSTREKLSGGGKPSGPVSFMRVYDAGAGVVKSGGKTRRAAKMQTLSCYHPDVLDFIECKAKEEVKARVLLAAGYSAGMTGSPDEAYSSVFFQNANLSVRVSDQFMKAAAGADEWSRAHYTNAVTTGERLERLDALDVLTRVAKGTWECGDPGLQYDDTINRWHTCPNSGRINSSNPCCFVGETLVNTSEGRLPIAQLAEMSSQGEPLPLAFSFDFDAGLPVLRPIVRAWKAGETAKLVEVQTDKGLTFHCTPEHRFYLRSGEAVEAKDLKPGHRLRKIGRGEAGRTPRTTIETRDATHYLSRWMWEQVNGPIPDGYEVHHVNEDRRDDRLSNFELVEAFEHRSNHARGLANARAIEVDDALLVETWEAIEALPRKTHKSCPPVTSARWNKYIRTNGLQGRVPLARGDGRIRGMAWDEFAAWIDSQRALVNDVVICARPLDLGRPVPVYDLEVQGTHNFEITDLTTRHGIIVSNSEYVFLDDSACNLASLNLLKFLRYDGTFDCERFCSAVRIFITAQEILVDRVSYPTKTIAENSHRFRPLGLGYANLGALLMTLGMPYDSDQGRALAASITALMHAEAYRTSAEIAAHKGSFKGFAENREPMLRVLDKHRAACVVLRKSSEGKEETEAWSLAARAEHIFDLAINEGKQHGFRNAQLTLLAPTGTIAFMMGCDTTGIEPATGLRLHKTLAGGGSMMIVDETVPVALKRLGYSAEAIARILDHLEYVGSLDDCGIIRDEHLAVFDCAFPGKPGGRSIPWRGHVAMMAAVQPFLSGAISKTVNMPQDATVEDIKGAYIEGWRAGLKALAIYRDGSKGQQPLAVKPAEDKPELLQMADAMSAADDHPEAKVQTWVNQWGDPAPATPVAAAKPQRQRLPDTRRSLTHKFSVGGHEGYITVGFYEDGRPGELFVKMAKEGSTIGGLMDGLATMISISLQYGVPLEVLVNKLVFTRFEPSGATEYPDVPFATSVTDYLGRWLGCELVPGFRDEHAPKREPLEVREPVPVIGVDLAEPGSERTVLVTREPGRAVSVAMAVAAELARTNGHGHAKRHQVTGPPCDRCGALMVRTGACHTCPVCGNAGGCG